MLNKIFFGGDGEFRLQTHYIRGFLGSENPYNGVGGKPLRPERQKGKERDGFGDGAAQLLNFSRVEGSSSRNRFLMVYSAGSPATRA